MWYVLPIGWLHATYHLLPESKVEATEACFFIGQEAQSQPFSTQTLKPCFPQQKPQIQESVVIQGWRVLNTSPVCVCLCVCEIQCIFMQNPWILNWFMIYWFLNKVFHMYRCCEKIPFLWQVHVLRGIYTLKCWFFIREGRQFFPLNSFKPTRCLDHWRHLLVGTNHFGWLRLVPMTDHSRSMQAQKVKKHVNSELLQDLLIWNRILQVMTIESFEVHMFTFMFPQKGVNRSKHLNKLGGFEVCQSTRRWIQVRRDGQTCDWNVWSEDVPWMQFLI